MAETFHPPASFAELIHSMDEVRAAFTLLNQLQNLQIVTRQSDGSLTTHPIQLNGDSAFVDLSQGAVLAGSLTALDPIPTPDTSADPRSQLGPNPSNPAGHANPAANP